MRNRSLLQQAAALFGVVFLVVGVAGFIPGLTTDYDELTAFGEVAAKLLGLFGVNVLENVVHLLYGVAGLVLARSWDGARTYFIGGGVIYLVLWIYGIAIDLESGANFIGVNTAGNWLHFALGLAMVGLGVALGRGPARDRIATT